MGKGDKKTKKGKIFKGSFGKSRPANVPKEKPKQQAKE
jgi:30S ribosomal protein S31